MRKTQHRNFHHQDYRHPQIELRMLCLMVEYLHSENSPDSSSENRQGKQRAFWNTPLSPDSLPFVYSEKKKLGNVNGKKINNETCSDIFT